MITNLLRSKRLQNIILCFLLAAWPCINYFGSNYLTLTSDIILLVMFFCATFFVTNLSLLYLYYRFLNKDGSGFLVLLLPCYIFFFNYAGMVDTLHAYDIPLKPTLIWVGLLSAVFLLSFKHINSPRAQYFMRFTLFGVFCASLINISFLAIKMGSQGLNQTNANCFMSFKHKPNIYFIMIDAYPRQDVLKENVGFDNEAFLQSLERFGFLVNRNAVSNYHFTIASLAATMNMQYHAKEMNESHYSLKKMLQSLSGDNRVRKTLKKQDYKVIDIPAYWVETKPKRKYQDAVLGDSPYMEASLSFFSGTPFRYAFAATKYNELEIIFRTFKMFPNSPKFIFSHFAQVHDTIYSGNRILERLSPHIQNPAQAKRLVSTLGVMNLKVLDAVKKIRSEDPTAIIILQSDHGPNYYDDKKSVSVRDTNSFRCCYGVLNALFLPNEYNPALYEKIKKLYRGRVSLVNTFRIVFSYLSEDKNLKLINSKFFHLIKVNVGYKNIDVSNFSKVGINNV